MDEIYRLWKDGTYTLLEVQEAVWKRLKTQQDDPTELGELYQKICKEAQGSKNVRK